MKMTLLPLVCPACHQPLAGTAEGFRCAACDRPFSLRLNGYLDFTLEPRLREIASTSDEYAAEQLASWPRFYAEFLKPWVERERSRRVLEVGCGMGAGIELFARDGYDAFGLDLPNLAPFWEREKRDPGRFFCGDGGRTPFPGGYFDAVFSLGTIEHIGTLTGHNTLSADYLARRSAFAAELLRITTPGGRILISCPNKSFPVDVHHMPTDEATKERSQNQRQAIFSRTGLNWHWPFGRYHLLSYREIRDLFCSTNGARAIRPVSAKSYFSFKRTGSLPGLKRFAPLIGGYIENLPGWLRGTFLNPFLIVEIRR